MDSHLRTSNSKQGQSRYQLRLRPKPVQFSGPEFFYKVLSFNMWSESYIAIVLESVFAQYTNQ